jgi:hypothetical protein
MTRWIGAGCLLVAIGCATAGPAGATGTRSAGGQSKCKGTRNSPGVLSGTYPSGAHVTGYCEVDGGAAVVDGDLTIGAGATLVATFAKNDVTGSGVSSLTVTGDLKVESRAILVMGCEPDHSACSDDGSGTLYGSDHIGGSLIAKHALGVVVHAATFGGNVTQSLGGGGETPASGANPASCIATPPGVFAQIGNGVFSDYEDNAIGGNLEVNGLRTCWIGIIRNHVSGDVTVTDNVFSDPDANETVQNTVGQNIACSGNSPAAQYGDSGASPNVVTGTASGECAFTLTSGTPVSVKA